MVAGETPAIRAKLIATYYDYVDAPNPPIPGLLLVELSVDPNFDPPVGGTCWFVVICVPPPIFVSVACANPPSANMLAPRPIAIAVAPISDSKWKRLMVSLLVGCGGARNPFDLVRASGC
jgi:hypothetical protein